MADTPTTTPPKKSLWCRMRDSTVFWAKNNLKSAVQTGIATYLVNKFINKL